MNCNFVNKVVVITGATGTIGKNITMAYGRENAKLALCFHKEDENEQELRKELLEHGISFILEKVELTNVENIKEFYKKVIDTYGQIDILINNAGICEPQIMYLLSDKKWNKVINTNLNSVFYMCKVFSKSMIKNRNGTIINISSRKGQHGEEGLSAYSASKAGIMGFTKSIAKELGKFNIAVNTVCPGYIKSNMNCYNNEKGVLPILLKSNALQDITNFILFITSDLSGGISGQIFNVDSRI